MPARLVSRRALVRAAGIGGLSGTMWLTGCDLDPAAPTHSRPAPPDPDERIVLAARAELSGLILRLSATRGQAALVACHQTQLAALGGKPPPTTQRSRPITGAQLVARERRAAGRFAHWALTCHNGDLARVLASVSAGIRTQHVLSGHA